MPESFPTRRPAGALLQRFGRFLLPLVRWRIEGELPANPKFVLILYPHTSNWDLFYGLISAAALGLLTEYEYGFMVKHTVLKAPIVGPIVRRLGGIGIDRSSSFNAVDQMVTVFSHHDRLMLGITPEGTRKRTSYWKSGFFHIARRANVPVVLTYLDYGRRVGGIGPVVHLTGDVETDLADIRHFYAPIRACHPEDAGKIDFRPDDRAREGAK